LGCNEAITIKKKGPYHLTVLNRKSDEQTKSTIAVDKTLWIHFNYVIYPESHPLKENEGIQIDINEAPQIYR
jgi:hypothetical protein